MALHASPSQSDAVYSDVKKARQPLAIHPTMAAPKINQAEFVLSRKIAMTLTAKIEIVSQSLMAASPSCHATTAISASDPTTTPSNTAPAAGERRGLGISGPLIATNTKPA